MFDIPIITLQQAKEYYKAMGCSSFHMSREYPLRYEEYKQLNISKQVETDWAIEQFDDYYNSIINKKKGVLIWNIHSRMSELAENLRTHELLDKILEATEYIRDKAPYSSRVIISETINGRSERQYRSGLIYLAYDLNNLAAAKRFIELSLDFATFKLRSFDLKRCQSAVKLCNEIRSELGI